MNKSYLKKVRRTFFQIWTERSQREKILIIFLAITALSILWLSLLVIPNLNGIQNGKRDLPILQERLKEIEALSKKLENSNLYTTKDPDKLQNQLLQSMQKKGFLGAEVSVTDDSYHVEITSIPFLDLVQWLMSTEYDTGLSISEGIIRVTDLPEYVKVSITLQ